MAQQTTYADFDRLLAACQRANEAERVQLAAMADMARAARAEIRKIVEGIQ
jgi:hypothetical protein